MLLRIIPEKSYILLDSVLKEEVLFGQVAHPSTHVDLSFYPFEIADQHFEERTATGTLLANESQSLSRLQQHTALSDLDVEVGRGMRVGGHCALLDEDFPQCAL